MSDPIEQQLADLGSTIEGGTMPRSAAEARRRGDQIRRRTHALVAAGSAVAVVAVAVPIIALATGDPATKEIPPAEDTPAQSVELAETDLINNADTVYAELVDWEVSSTVEGDGQSAYNPCAERGLSEMDGAGTTFTRTFEQTTPDGPIASSWMTETIAEFGSPAAARAAYDDIATAVEGCAGRIAGADRYDLTQSEAVGLPVDGEAHRFLSWWGPVSGDEFDELSNIMETGLVVTGDRIAVLTSVVVGQDYNFDPTPVTRMLPAAAQRLQPGRAGEPVPDSGAVTVIPNDFPLALDLPAPDETETFEEPSRESPTMIAGSELDACGENPDGGTPVDRMTTRITGADSGTARELQLFADETEAQLVFGALGGHFEECSTDESEPPYVVDRTTTFLDYGDESFVVESAVEGGVGRTALLVVRWDNALFLQAISDAGSDAAALRDEGNAMAETVIGLVRALVEGEDVEGSGSEDGGLVTETPGDDPVDTGEPAQVTSTIADDYPLAEGWPAEDSESTIEGPARGGAFEPEVCGRTFQEPAYAERLTASFLAPEDGRVRRLTTYETADAAVAAVAALRAAYQECQQEDTEPDGFVAHHTVRQTDVGGESWIISRHYTYQGDPTTGLHIIRVIRVGLAVLVIEGSNEGGASGEINQEVDAQVAGMDEQAEAAIAAMCVFTEAGC